MKCVSLPTDLRFLGTHFGQIVEREEDEKDSPVALHGVAGQGHSGLRLPAPGLPQEGAQLRLGKTRSAPRTLQVNHSTMLHVVDFII